MKTSAKILSLIQYVMLTSAISFAGNKNTTSSDTSRRIAFEESKCLEVKVRPTENNITLTGVSIRVYQDNEIVSEVSNDKATIQNISLKSDNLYTIEISKKGYYSKLVRISTAIPSQVECDNELAYLYDLQIELVKEKPGIESFYLDFPIALISYDKKTDRFKYSRKYTNGIVKEIRKEAGPGFASNYNRN